MLFFFIIWCVNWIRVYCILYCFLLHISLTLLHSEWPKLNGVFAILKWNRVSYTVFVIHFARLCITICQSVNITCSTLCVDFCCSALSTFFLPCSCQTSVVLLYILMSCVNSSHQLLNMSASVLLCVSSCSALCVSLWDAISQYISRLWISIIRLRIIHNSRARH